LPQKLLIKETAKNKNRKTKINNMANNKDEVPNSSNKGLDTADLSPEDLLAAFIMKQSTAEITENLMAINFLLTKSNDDKPIKAEDVVKRLDEKKCHP